MIFLIGNILSFFDQAYTGTPPWDIGKAQTAFKRLTEKNTITGPLLDIGCGTGENTLFFANLGLNTLGIDMSPNAITKANTKAKERHLEDKAQFMIYDLFKLPNMNQTFNTIIDCGVFHMFDKERRKLYEKSISHIVEPNGKIFILSFSYKEPLGIGPPQRLREEDFMEAFNSGSWTIESFMDEEFYTNAHKNPAKALFTTIKKN